jgi:hypothetical protein
VGGTCSILAAMAEGAGDFIPEPPIGVSHVRLITNVRVFEVNSPEDWHDLSTRYRAIDEQGRVVPDWGRVTHEWDAVHLTLGGLLVAEQVRVESSAGWTELRMWDAEQTAWLRWCFESVDHLPDLEAPPPSPIDLGASMLHFHHSNLFPGSLWRPHDQSRED